MRPPKCFTGLVQGLLVYEDLKWNTGNGTTSLAKERDSEEMVKEVLWDLTLKWGQVNVNNKSSTSPKEAVLDATTTP